MATPRLDILIYAHDGRGLGHASRSVGIGMALRRLYPNLKVLFVSGCRQSQELISTAPLDWLKLPSYETKVENGRSTGLYGKSMFSDAQLGEFRAGEIEHLVCLYRPRIVLVDHTPQGKHRELVPAIARSRDFGTRWILGVRGIIGEVSQAGSDLASTLFRKYYCGLLWYGDRAILGEAHLNRLKLQYGMVPTECGYVSRLAEVEKWMGGVPGKSAGGAELAGTVSVPWLGENSLFFLKQLADTLSAIGGKYGNWHLFVDSGDSAEIEEKVWSIFSRLSHCTLQKPGPRYNEALLRSKTAVIYGGYNSLMDVLYAGIPALVVTRGMRDNEQQLHLQLLQKTMENRIHVIPEAKTPSYQIRSFLCDNLSKNINPSTAVNLDGAAGAAAVLHRLLDKETGR